MTIAVHEVGATPTAIMGALEPLTVEASNATKSKSTKAVIHRTHKRRKALSDAELAERLAHYAPLTDADFPEVSAEE